MKNFKYTLISAAFWIMSISILAGCVYVIWPGFDSSTNTNSSYESSYEDSDLVENYPDGTYSAEVNYYNPDTGTSSSYTLDVEVVNNEVTVIHWPSGGWLDDSHFTPQELDSNGSCSFTSDVGSQYDVQISESPSSSSNDDDYESNPAEDHEQ